jgi:hypothetical protein
LTGLSTDFFSYAFRRMPNSQRTDRDEGEQAAAASKVATGRGAFTGATGRGTDPEGMSGRSLEHSTTGEARIGLGPSSAATPKSSMMDPVNQRASLVDQLGANQTGTSILSVYLDQYPSWVPGATPPVTSQPTQTSPGLRSRQRP